MSYQMFGNALPMLLALADFYGATIPNAVVREPQDIDTWPWYNKSALRKVASAFRVSAFNVGRVV